MRYSRELEFPDCTTAEQAQDAIMRLSSVVVLPREHSYYTVQVGATLYHYASWVTALEHARQIKPVVLEPGTNKLCWSRPLLIVSVRSNVCDLDRLLRRPKLRKLKS